MLRAFSLALLLATLGAFGPQSVAAQSDVPNCGTVLTKAGAKDAVEALKVLGTGACARPPYYINIKPHIIRRSDGTGGLTLTELNDALDDINAAYASMEMIFDYLQVDYIDDDEYFNEVRGSEYEDLRLINAVSAAVNIYFVPDLAFCGLASYPNAPIQGVLIQNDCVGVPYEATIVHEIGHHFWLLHTFDDVNGTECVDGSNCATAGDLVCDTPAEPPVAFLGANFDFNCDYFGAPTDPPSCGENPYNPDGTQFMTYNVNNSSGCRNNFSPGSQQRVLDVMFVYRPEYINAGPSSNWAVTAVSSSGNTRALSSADVNGDGYPDLHATREQTDFLLGDPPNELYYGGASGLSSSGLGEPVGDKGDGYATAWADFDNDGDPDLVFANKLVIGGGFDPRKIRLSRTVKHNGCPSACSFTLLGSPYNGDMETAAWADIDIDGLVDAYLGGTEHRLLSNSGSSFTDVAAGSGINVALDVAFATFVDYDNDRDPDLMLVPTTGNPILYQNDGTGAFTDVTPSAFSFSVSVAEWLDYDNDGNLDVYFGRTGATNILLRNNGAGSGWSFSDVSAVAGVGHDGTTTALVALDYDADGHIDLYVVDATQCNYLYRNLGNGSFADATESIILGRVGDAAAVAADFDLDGRDEIAVAGGSSLTILDNLTSGNGNHWLSIELVGRGAGHSNRNGIGARIEVTANGVTQSREVSGGDGFDQDHVVNTFGLGASSSATQITVRWPSGAEQTIHDVTGGRLIRINEPFHGSIAASKTWSGIVYLDGDVNIEAGVELTVDAGTTVYVAGDDDGGVEFQPFFNTQVEIHIVGSMVVNGSAASPVEFRSAASSPTEMDWAYIQPLNGSLTMTYTTLRDSEWGITALGDATSAFVIDECVFVGNQSADFRTFGSPATVSVTNSDFILGYGTAIEVRSPNAVIVGNTITGSAHAGYGIKLIENATAVIDNNTIVDPTSSRLITGISLLKGSSTVTNTIISGCNKGIEVRDGTHTIGELDGGNEIADCTYGIWVRCSGPGLCPPSCGTLDVTVRYTEIHDNQDGVYSIRNAVIDLGQSGGYGNNTIRDNTGDCVWTNVDATCVPNTIAAVGNYWGSCAAPTCTSGSVDTSEYLCGPPSSSAVGDDPVAEGAVPKRTALLRATPNPFNPTTTINFELAEASAARIAIYDVAGRLVRDADLGTRPAGRHSWVWDARSRNGVELSSGVYFVVLEAGSLVDRQKVVLLK